MVQTGSIPAAYELILLSGKFKWGIALMNYFCAFCGNKIVLGYSRYLQMFEYFRMGAIS